jgi:hypothetical protein
MPRKFIRMPNKSIKKKTEDIFLVISPQFYQKHNDNILNKYKYRTPRQSLQYGFSAHVLRMTSLTIVQSRHIYAQIKDVPQATTFIKEKTHMHRHCLIRDHVFTRECAHTCELISLCRSTAGKFLLARSWKMQVVSLASRFRSLLNLLQSHGWSMVITCTRN